jgi:HEAT repeat protein
MRTRQGDSDNAEQAGRAGKAGRAGWPGRLLLVSLGVLFLPAIAIAQVPYDQAVGGLTSPDPKVRLHSATLLKESAYVEAGVPLAKLVGDPDNAVQLEAIAALVNIFTVGKGAPKRIGFIRFEDWSRRPALAAFEGGPLVLGTAPVPPAVLLALRLAARDDSPAVSIEALYAFGALGSQLSGRARRDLLQRSTADMAGLLAMPDPELRLAAVRVIGRLYKPRPGDAPVDTALADLVITAVNESDRAMKAAAMETLGDIHEVRAVAGLTELLDFYGQGELALPALSALARIGDRSSAPVFLMRLKGKWTPKAKALAIAGLARTGDASHMAAIQGALKQEHDDLVIAASNFAATMLSNAPAERLVDALNRPNLHDAVRGYLVEIAPGHVSRLSRYAQDPEARMRIDIADIVGLADDPQGVQVVEPLLADMDKQVVFAAERAMRRLNADR